MKDNFGYLHIGLQKNPEDCCSCCSICLLSFAKHGCQKWSMLFACTSNLHKKSETSACFSQKEKPNEHVWCHFLNFAWTLCVISMFFWGHKEIWQISYCADSSFDGHPPPPAFSPSSLGIKRVIFLVSKTTFFPNAPVCVVFKVTKFATNLTLLHQGSNILKTAPKVSPPKGRDESNYPQDFLFRSDRWLTKLPIHSCSLSHTHLDLIQSCFSSNASIKIVKRHVRIHHLGSKKKLLWKNAKHIFMAHKHWKLRAPCPNMFHS